MTNRKGVRSGKRVAGANAAARSPATPVVIVAGPTASGKSALALAAAEAFGGVVINADSMQLYRDLPILTARPGERDRAAVPHRLYGVLPGRDPCTVARWRDLALAEIDRATRSDTLPLVVGGTGLYLHALVTGLAPVPDIPREVRTAARALLAEIGPAALHDRLATRDPVAAERIAPSDSQRMVRAWEVLEATGRSLAEWQRDPPEMGAAANYRFLAFLLLPPRPTVYAACDARFAAMIEDGAVDEVAALLAQGLDPDLPVMKAVGVREIAAYLDGACDLGSAVGRGQQATRRYAKRQYTWFRHQLPGAVTINEQYSESLKTKIFAKIRHFLLTEGD